MGVLSVEGGAYNLWGWFVGYGPIGPLTRPMFGSPSQKRTLAELLYGLVMWMFMLTTARRVSSGLLDAPGCDGVDPFGIAASCQASCCAYHDQCYDQNKCSASSFLLSPLGTPCARCNDRVVNCIIACNGAPGLSGYLPNNKCDPLQLCYTTKCGGKFFCAGNCKVAGTPSGWLSPGPVDPETGNDECSLTTPYNWDTCSCMRAITLEEIKLLIGQ